METIRGIVEHGRIRLITTHSLPQGAEIEFEPRLVQDKPGPASLGCNSAELYEILSRSHDTGIPNLAERHNEHQP
jgi:hypothetical protein